MPQHWAARVTWDHPLLWNLSVQVYAHVCHLLCLSWLFLLVCGLPSGWSGSTHTHRKPCGQLLLSGKKVGLVCVPGQPGLQTALLWVMIILFPAFFFSFTVTIRSFRLFFAPEGVGGKLEMISSQISSTTPFRPIWIFLLDYFLIWVWVILPSNNETI